MFCRNLCWDKKCVEKKIIMCWEKKCVTARTSSQRPLSGPWQTQENYFFHQGGKNWYRFEWTYKLTAMNNFRVFFAANRAAIIFVFASFAWSLSSFMHQSIPPAPSSPAPTPPGNCGALTRLVSPGGGAFANVALPGGRAFANPWANPELLTRTRFPIRI